MSYYDDIFKKYANNKLLYYYFNKNDYNNAIKECNNIIKENSELDSAYFIRGLCKYLSGNNENSIEDFDKAIEINKKNSQYYIFRGGAKAKLLKPKEAIEDYTCALNIDPGDYDIYKFIGYNYGQLFQYETAIRNFNKSLELGLSRKEYYFCLIDIPALLEYNNILLLNNMDYYYLGLEYFYRKRYIEALEFFDYSIKINSIMPDIYILIALCKEILGDFENAILNYNKSLELYPSLEEANYRRGYLFFKLKKYDLAIKDFDRVIDVDSENSGAYYYRAIIKNCIGENKEALLDVNKAIELDPKIPGISEFKNYLIKVIKEENKSIVNNNQQIKRTEFHLPKSLCRNKSDKDIILEKIGIINSDITKIQTDAIVNATNSSFGGEYGVHGAILRVAGENLKEECLNLKCCKVGESKITNGYNLPAKYVIHTVGPIWKGGNNYEKELLRACYITILEKARLNGIKTIAIPSISCGIRQFPINLATQIAVNTVVNYMAHYTCFDRIYFVDINPEIVDSYNKYIKNLKQ